MRHFLFFFLASAVALKAHATDPFTSVYNSVDNESASADEIRNWKDGDWKSGFTRFRFADRRDSDPDSFLGGLGVSRSSDTQAFRFNVANFNLWMGGNIKQPVQVYLADVAPTASGEGVESDVNAEKLLDPENGIAIKFPVLFTYQRDREEGGLCAFLSDRDSIGHCSIGADLTLNFRELEGASDVKETGTGVTVRVGGGVLFPLLSVDDENEQGYLSFSAKAIYAYTNVEDPTQLFQPVTGLDGNAVAFDDTIFAGDFELKFAVNGQFAISARWLTPFNNDEYIDDVFRVAIQTQF